MALMVEVGARRIAKQLGSWAAERLSG